MLTGQGTPTGALPWYTKCIVVLTAIFSVPIFVIPAGMLTWGFEAEAERLMRKRRDRRRKKTLAKTTGQRVDTSSSSSSDGSKASHSGGSDNDGVDGPSSTDCDDTDDDDDRPIGRGGDNRKVWDEYEDVVLGDSDDGGGKGGLAEHDRKLLQQMVSLLSPHQGVAGEPALPSALPSLATAAPAHVAATPGSRPGQNGSSGILDSIAGGGATGHTANAMPASSVEDRMGRMEAKIDGLVIAVERLLGDGR
jgi:hypothetical protein